ncbi:MAG: hypothetical protein R3D27_15190 [Hyphomicrobiaceae bacterium]
MLRKLMHIGLALAVIAGAGLTSVQPAEARGGRFAAGVAAGIIGLGVLGAYAHARDRAYYDGPYYRSRYYYRGGCYRGRERCWRTERDCWLDRYGERVCRGGTVRCHRPLICD